MPLESKIESILFYKSEPVSVSELSAWTGRGKDEVKAALDKLAEVLENRGIRLIRKDDEVALATAPEASELLEKIRQDEMSKELGKAGTETLAIIAYEGPISRAEIDHIRGVNSSFILRNLQIRGLVEKIVDPKDSRRWLYRPTFDLLSHLGVEKISDLPEYEAVREKIENFEKENEVEDLPAAEEESTTIDENFEKEIDEKHSENSN